MTTVSAEHDRFVRELADKLRKPYEHTQCAGHDVWHVQRMLILGERIRTILDFDWYEFVAAAWLHNLDRAPQYRGPICTVFGSVAGLALDFLKDSPFSEEARQRIALAAATHGKKDDEPGDSTLLTALRIADKLDRFNPLGALTAAMIHGYRIPLYDPDDPFGYESTEYDRLKTVYNDFFRLLEWVDMLPSDEARGLIDRAGLLALIDFIRSFGAYVARLHTLKPNTEEDIKRALGRHYETFAFPAA